MKKKVVWLCTFTNARKRSHLRLWRDNHHEGGQWIPNLLSKASTTFKEFDIHVLSIEPWMCLPYQQWTEENITFHCIPDSFPILGRSWPHYFPVDVLTQYANNSRRIKRVVEAIKPDIIQLFGAENPEYASAILDLKAQYPVLITIQGFVCREPCYPFSVRKSIRVVVENRILQSFKYFMGEYESRDVVKIFNRSSTCFPMYYPVDEALVQRTLPNQKKKYDLLFVGRLCPQKGILDFVRMVAMIRKQRASVRAAIVGSIYQYPPLMDLIEALHLSEVVSFLPRFPSQAGLFDLYCQSRLFVAPTYNDCFPCTIRECAFLGTPVLAYATGGIPYANQNGRENVALVETGKMEVMADKALSILGNEAYQKTLSRNLQQLAADEYSLDRNVSRMLEAYDVIMTESKKGTVDDIQDPPI